MPADTNPYGGVFGGWLMSADGARRGGAGEPGGAGQGGRRKRPPTSPSPARWRWGTSSPSMAMIARHRHHLAHRRRRGHRPRAQRRGDHHWLRAEPSSSCCSTRTTGRAQVRMRRACPLPPGTMRKCCPTRCQLCHARSHDRSRPHLSPSVAHTLGRRHSPLAWRHFDRTKRHGKPTRRRRSAQGDIHSRKATFLPLGPWNTCSMSNIPGRLIRGESWLTELRRDRARLRPRRLCRGNPLRAARASKPGSSSARTWVASASTGAASRRRRCCVRPRSSTTCSTPGDYGLESAAASRPIFRPLSSSVQPRRGQAAQPGRYAHLMKKNKITVHMGDRHADRGEQSLTVKGEKGEEKLTAKHIIVATGARARDLPFAKADGKRVWTYRHAMTPDRDCRPRCWSSAAGAIGIEFASFYNDHRQRSDRGGNARPHRAGRGRRCLRPSSRRVANASRASTIMTGAGVEALKRSPTSGVTATIKAKDWQRLAIQ
jgi:hypothetical protein